MRLAVNVHSRAERILYLNMAASRRWESGQPREVEIEGIMEMPLLNPAKPNIVALGSDCPNHNINPQPAQKTKRPFRPQLIIMMSSYVCNIAAGMSVGHSAVLLPELQKANSSLTIDENISSWIASSHVMAGPAGTLFAGIFMEIYGRKCNIITANAMMTIGWLFIAGAQEKFMILFGRTIEGFSRCMLYAGVAVIVDELSDPKYRGFIMGCCGTFASVGILIISGLGTCVDWRTASWMAAAMSFASLLIFPCVSESPVWLVRKNRIPEANRSLSWIWGPQHSVKATEELLDLQQRYLHEECIGHSHQGRTGLITKIRHSFRICRSLSTPSILKPLVIILIFNIFQPICGHSLFMFYAVDILHRMQKNNFEIIDENLETILLSVVRLLSVTLSSFCMFRLGRREIGIISGIGASVSGIFIAVILYMNLLEQGSPIPPIIEAWIILVLIIFFIGSHSFGFYMLPALMIGETQAAQVRSTFCGCIFTITDLILFGVLKGYHSILKSVDIHGMFLIFGISCLFCTIFIYIFLPETRKKTLMEIEDYFRKQNVMWLSREKY